MDSYNRGYGAGLNNTGAGDQDGLGGQGSQIGIASVILDDVSQAAQSAGFYAVAYETQYGTVISYRACTFPRNTRSIARIPVTSTTIQLTSVC